MWKGNKNCKVFIVIFVMCACRKSIFHHTNSYVLTFTSGFWSVCACGHQCDWGTGFCYDRFVFILISFRLASFNFFLIFSKYIFGSAVVLYTHCTQCKQMIEQATVFLAKHVASTLLAPVLLLFMLTVCQFLYTCTVKHVVSLASVEFWRVAGNFCGTTHLK